MPVKEFTGTLDEPAQAKPFDGLLDDETSSVWRRYVADPALSLLKGAVGVPEAAVGLADIATGGYAGKGAEAVGFRPKEAKEYLDTLLSPEQREANRRVQETKGFFPTIGAAIQNPSTIAHSVLESAPSIGAGGVLARGAMAAAPKLAPLVAGAMGEGAVSAGSTAEQIRQATPTGTLSLPQAALAAGSGAATAGFGVAGGKLAHRLGIADIDTLIAAGKLPEGAKKSLARRIGEGIFIEGPIEELPQSAQEQIAQNLALGKPVMEGVPEAGAMGMLAGGVIGGGVAAMPTKAPTQEILDRNPDPRKAAEELLQKAAEDVIRGTDTLSQPETPNDQPQLNPVPSEQATSETAAEAQTQEVIPESGTIAPKTVGGIPVSAQSTEQLQAIEQDPGANLNSRRAAREARRARIQNLEERPAPQEGGLPEAQNVDTSEQSPSVSNIASVSVQEPVSAPTETAQPAEISPVSASSPLLDAIAKAKTDLQTQLDTWNSKKYKDNRTQVQFEGDGPARNESMSIGAINENRKRKTIDALSSSLKSANALETVLQQGGPEADRLTRGIEDTWRKANEAAKREPELYKDVGALFEEMLLRDVIKMSQAGRGAIVSTPVSKIIRAAMESPAPAAQPSPAVPKPQPEAAPPVEPVKEPTEPVKTPAPDHIAGAGKMIERFTGQYKKGMGKTVAQQQQKRLTKERPDLTWKIEPAPEFGDQRFQVVGYGVEKATNVAEKATNKESLPVAPEETPEITYPDRQAATKAAQKLTKAGQKHVVRPVKGGFVVEPKETREPTEKQVAARAAAAQRWRVANQARRRPNPVTQSLNEWLAKRGGIALSERNDIVGEGNKSFAGMWLFKREGEGIDNLARRAYEDGYLTDEEYNSADGGVQALKDKIAEEFNGQRQHYSSQRDQQTAQPSEEDVLAEQAGALGIDTKGLSVDELREQIKAAQLPQQALIEAELKPTPNREHFVQVLAGLSPEDLAYLVGKYGDLPEPEFIAAVLNFVKEKPDVGRSAQIAQGGPVAEAPAAAQTETKSAEVAQAGVVQPRGTRMYHISPQANRDTIVKEGLRKGSMGWVWLSPSLEDSKSAAKRLGNQDIWEIDVGGLTVGEDPLHRGFEGSRATLGAIPASRIMLLQEAPALELTVQTPEELAAREAEQEAAAKAEEAATRAREEAERAERERKEIAQRSESAEFSLSAPEAVDRKTQQQIDAKRAADQLAGQGDIFSQPANTLSPEGGQVEQPGPEYNSPVNPDQPTEVRVDPDDLSRAVLARMDVRLKALGYDSRGFDDVRTMLKTRIAPDGVITQPDWIAAYEAAVAGAEKTRERVDAKRTARNQATHVDFARMRELGLTEDWREAGYITPRGSLIDLSGKREGGERGMRSYDHREAGGTIGMQEYMALGNIRIDANTGSIDISREPTPEQYKRIVELAENKGGEITVDLEQGLGELRGDYYLKPERSFSREYPVDTKPARILADIRRFFAGEEPRPLLGANQTGLEYNPDQPEQIYDHIETREGTTQAQKDAGIRALAGWVGMDTELGRGNNGVGMPEGTLPRATLLGSALWDGFSRHGGAELIGQQVGSAQELALASQILRNDDFEVMRVWLTKGGKIVGHTATTARLAGSTQFTAEGQTPFDRIAEIKAMMEDKGADGYWLLHNHPNGLSKPSSPDVYMTKWVAANLPGFRGHVIIDHNEYTLINARGVSKLFSIKSPQSLAPELPHKLLGRQITGPVALTEVGKELGLKKGWVTVVTLSSIGKIQTLAEIPESELTEGAAAKLHRFLNKTGSGGLFLITENPERFDTLIEHGVVTDTIDPTGQRIGRFHVAKGKQGVGMLNARQRVLRAEQMVWHGSPYVFPPTEKNPLGEFDPSKVGTGEGAAAYGWGVAYLAGRKGVGEFYRDKLTGGARAELNMLTATKDGRKVSGWNLLPEYFKPGRIVRAYAGWDEVISFNGNPIGRWDVTVKSVKDQFGRPPDSYHNRPRTHATTPSSKEVVDVLSKDGWKFDKPGKLYQVDLAPQEDEWLDWDRPLSEQSKEVRGALEKAGFAIEPVDDIDVDLLAGLGSNEARADFIDGEKMTGERLYQTLVDSAGSQKAASLRLAEIGIPGIRYKDATSRNDWAVQKFSDGWHAWERSDLESKARATRKVFQTESEARTYADSHITYNYVIFDDKLAKIVGVEQPTPGYDPDSPNILEQEGPGYAISQVMRSPKLAGLIDAITTSPASFGTLRNIHTQYHKAVTLLRQGKPEFKAVFDRLQTYLNDINAIAITAEQKAPAIFRELTGMRPSAIRDYFKGAAKESDIKAISPWLNAGTLYGGPSPMDGVVWTDDELKGKQDKRPLPRVAPLTDKQIELYHQARAAIAQAIQDGAKSIIYRYVKRHGVDFDKTDSLDQIVASVKDQLQARRDELGIRADQAAETLDEAQSDADQAAQRYAADPKEGMTRAEADRTKKALETAQSALDKIRADIEAVDALLGTKGRPGTKGAKESLFEAGEQAQDEVKEVVGTIDKIDQQANGLIEHGYMPLKRFGNKTVTARDENGKVQFFGAFDGVPLVPGSATVEMNQTAAEIRRLHPAWTVTTGMKSERSWQMFNGLSIDALENFLDFLDPETKAELERDKTIQEYITKAVNNRSVMKELVHRKGMPGFSQDVPRILASFITSHARNASGLYHLGEAKGLVEKIPQEQGDIKDEATDLVRYVTEPGEEAAKLRGFLFFHFLGGSVASAAVNLSQTVMMTAPYLSQYGNAKLVVKSLLSAAKSAVMDPAAIAGEKGVALQKAERDGITAPQQIYHLTATAANNPFSSNRHFRTFMTIWGGMFSAAEVFNRRVAFLAAYDIAKSNGMEKTEAYDFARETVEVTQLIYNKGNKPNWGRGAVGSTIMTFKTFSIGYLELMQRLPPKQQLMMLGVLLLMAGGEGAPFAEDIEDLVDTLGQWLGFSTNTGKWTGKVIRNTLGPEFERPLLKGLGGMLPLDLHSRLGMHNLLPGTAFFKPSEIDKKRDVAEAVGPIGSVVTNLMDSLALLSRGKWDAAAVGAAPKAARDAYNGVHMAITGESQDTKGRLGMKDITPIEGFSKLIGFNPQRAAIEGEAKREIMLDRNLRLVRMDEIASDWADGILRKDEGKKQEARSRWRQWNIDNPEAKIASPQLMRSVQERVKAARKTSKERFLKSVPKPMRGEAKEALQ